MADENKSKDVLVHADHVKVYFKGKDKKSGTVRAVDDISFDIFAGFRIKRQSLKTDA